MYILVEGIAEVLIKQEKGEEVRVKSVSPYSIFGEMSLLTGEARTATIKCITGCALFEISKTDFSSLLQMRPELTDNLSIIIAERKLQTIKSSQNSNISNVPQEQQNIQLNTIISQEIRAFFGI